MLPGESVQDSLHLPLLPPELLVVRDLPQGSDSVGNLDTKRFILSAIVTLSGTFGCRLSSICCLFVLSTLPEHGVGFGLGQSHAQDLSLPQHAVDQLHCLVSVLLQSQHHNSQYTYRSNKVYTENVRK